MRSGSPHNYIASALLTCALAGAALFNARAATTNDVSLPELMQKLSRVETAGGRFVERKYLSILSEPLTLRGHVIYRAPDYVAKEYDDPNGERYEVRGDRLVIELADGRQRELTIDEHPVLRAFVESYRGTLAGDLATLEQYFDLELGGTMDEWRLLLIPKLAELTEYLTAVVLQGRGGTVYEVHTREAGGDHSVMRIENSGD